ncbi:hypothetical protein DPQ25_08335 [Hydrogeniiclostridium mannosilyticum]|uniref:Uncharacterized protein n=1 Tax=Hydrogeniiclostridium mannosilyticum TaxID=2764322 RepID=A0A328UB72_9FIRM|nr:hypothetical protein DPQ25_08335 [Hydrogeniiclostridium mannosilyticum]
MLCLNRRLCLFNQGPDGCRPFLIYIGGYRAFSGCWARRSRSGLFSVKMNGPGPGRGKKYRAGKPAPVHSDMVLF